MRTQQIVVNSQCQPMIYYLYVQLIIRENITQHPVILPIYGFGFTGKFYDNKPLLPVTIHRNNAFRVLNI